MRDRARALRDWSRHPLILTRRVAIALAAALGILGAGGILLGASALDDVAEERADREEVDQLTAADVEAIARRIVRLERPPTKELVRRILKALDACREDERCGRQLREATRPLLGEEGASSPEPAPPALPPAGPTDPPRSRPRARTRPHDRPKPTPAPPAPRPPGGPDPPRPPAPVDVGTPELGPVGKPQICTGILDVNC